MDRNFKRLLDTLRLIPRKRWASTAQVHEGLQSLGHQVARRTVQRDLEALAAEYGIECDRREQTYGWRWQRASQVPVMPELDLNQALAILFMERELAEMMPGSVVEAMEPWVAQAKRVAAARSGTRAARWLDKVAFEPMGPPLMPAKIEAGTWRTLLEALHDERQISAEYRRAYSEAWKPATLHPLGLVKTGLNAYLVARFEGFDDVRLLAAHRLKNVRVLPEAAAAPIGFDLQVFLSDQGMNFGADKVPVCIRMTADAAHHLRDTPLAADQEITPCRDDPAWVEVRATVADSPRLQWWINGFGDQAQRVGAAGTKDFSGQSQWPQRDAPYQRE